MKDTVNAHTPLETWCPARHAGIDEVGWPQGRVTSGHAVGAVAAKGREYIYREEGNTHRAQCGWRRDIAVQWISPKDPEKRRGYSTDDACHVCHPRCPMRRTAMIPQSAQPHCQPSPTPSPPAQQAHYKSHPPRLQRPFPSTRCTSRRRCECPATPQPQET